MEMLSSSLDVTLQLVGYITGSINPFSFSLFCLKQVCSSCHIAQRPVSVILISESWDVELKGFREQKELISSPIIEPSCEKESATAGLGRNPYCFVTLAAESCSRESQKKGASSKELGGTAECLK